MRELTIHKVNGLNEALRVRVLDEPGPGGACHHYLIEDATRVPINGNGEIELCSVHFQNGGVAEVGVTGISIEALIAIAIDRLQGFQTGPFKCRDNACALTHFEEGLMWLQKRTRERMARGVEGTQQP